MKPNRVTLADGSIDPIPVNLYPEQIHISLYVKVTGTITYDIEHTYDDVFAKGYDPAAGNWLVATGHADLTADKETEFTKPITAVRVTKTAGGGSADIVCIQSGMG